MQVLTMQQQATNIAAHSTNTGRHTMTTTAKQAKIARIIKTKDAAVAIELFSKWIGKAQTMLEVLSTPEHIAAVQTEVELYRNAISQLQEQQADQHDHKRIEYLLNAAEYSRKQQYTKTADALIAEAPALMQDELDRLYQLQHNLQSSYYSALAMVDDYFNPRRTLLQSLSAEQITAKLNHWRNEVAVLGAELDRVQALIDTLEAV